MCSSNALPACRLHIENNTCSYPSSEAWSCTLTCRPTLKASLFRQRVVDVNALFLSRRDGRRKSYWTRCVIGWAGFCERYCRNRRCFMVGLIPLVVDEYAGKSGWQSPLAHRNSGEAVIKAIREPTSSTEQPLQLPDGSPWIESDISQNGAATEDPDKLTKELQSTLRLVECAMLAATVGLAYFLSNLLRIENYFGFFFPLPPVISSLRWGAAAGRKTMVATVVLLFVLSGPLKAASYLLMHGLVGITMGALWRWDLSWGLSLVMCTLIRSLGALGFVFLTSWLLRDNLLSLIIINAHASISYMLAAVGINIVPSMGMIYFIFTILLLLNCGSFVFLLHILYAIFLRRLGIKSSLSFPAWLKAI